MTGEEFKQARLNRRLTQRKLGRLLGYEDDRTAERTVQFWEDGEREVPLKHIRKLSEILHVPIDKFIP